MASRIEHRAEFSQDVSEVFAAQSDKPALQARLAAVGGENSEVKAYAQSDGNWQFLLHQGISADKLPSAIRSLHRGDLVVEREQTWTAAGESYTGTIKATVSGVPGEITALSDLRAEDGKTVLRTTGEVKIRIPLVGGKLEAFVADQITKLLQREAEFTSQWLAGNS